MFSRLPLHVLLDVVGLRRAHGTRRGLTRRHKHTLRFADVAVSPRAGWYLMNTAVGKDAWCEGSVLTSTCYKE
eukprot:COSAG02_NODE_10968_length_1822_cov_1.257690_2_plen_73_part_00